MSVVIPCKNAEAVLGYQLAALTAQDFEGEIEIIVADNGSTDGSRRVAEDYPGVTVVDASARPSPNHARNVGFRAASGPLILTCDADDVADVGWISAMAKGLAEFDLVGGVLETDSLNAPHLRRPPSDATERRARYGFLPIAPGANFGIRTEALEALEGWDESFDGGPDDTELCWRAQLAGYRIGLATDAVMHCRRRSTVSATVKQAFDGGRRIPRLLDVFHEHGLGYRGLIKRALLFGTFLVLAIPALPFSRRLRVEWVRRAALSAGVARGVFGRRSLTRHS